MFKRWYISALLALCLACSTAVGCSILGEESSSETSSNTQTDNSSSLEESSGEKLPEEDDSNGGSLGGGDSDGDGSNVGGSSDSSDDGSDDTANDSFGESSSDASVDSSNDSSNESSSDSSTADSSTDNSNENSSNEDGSGAESTPDDGTPDDGTPEEHTHEYTALVTAPTCTAQGYTTYICECSDSYVGDYTDALKHLFTNYVSNGDATCTEDGTETAVCDRVGCEERDTQTDEGSQLPHDYTAVVTPPTCTAQGYTMYTCACTDSYVGN